MDLVAGTHGRGIYMMNLRPLQQAFAAGRIDVPVLFEPPAARLPWINDTHRDPRLSSMEKVPFTFYLPRAADVTLEVIDDKERTRWRRDLTAERGFNQFRWDLVVRRKDSPRPYFVHYLEFLPAGAYTLRISGEEVELSAPFTVVERDKPPVR